jgi:hypothetical protein
MSAVALPTDRQGQHQFRTQNYGKITNLHSTKNDVSGHTLTHKAPNATKHAGEGAKSLTGRSWLCYHEETGIPYIERNKITDL